jgi:nicotinamide mononucleotide transporter
MPVQLADWLSANYIELIGATLGIAYIIFSIKQNIFTWPTGLATSALYIIIFFQAKLYADMSLQFYYVIISIYGWWLWLKGSNPDGSTTIKVTKITKNFATKISIISLMLWFIIYYILSRHTDSLVPVLDSFTTALSISATYLLARKVLEHWILWIIIDLVSVGLYIFKGLWPTTLLFLIYSAMAIIGYRSWLHDLNKQPLLNAKYA